MEQPSSAAQAAQFRHRFPRLFRPGVGCFIPEIVTDLPFISEPDTSNLKQSVFSARMKIMAEAQIAEWESQGIIQEVHYTPKAVTPILMVPKPHSDAYRLCLDFRLVNSCCRQVYSPPIDRHALIQDLPRKRIFSVIDISSAFTCIRLAEHLQTYFGIEMGGRHFVFTRLPFGFHNSMHLFLRAIHYTLSKARKQLPDEVNLLSYVDDLCVASDSKAAHLKALEIIFHHLEVDGWTINLSKCKLLRPCVTFLGIQYSTLGISPDPELLTKFDSLDLPKSSSELRTLFGMSLCLQPFNYKLNEILKPLRDFCRAAPDAFQTEAFRSCWHSCIKSLQENVWRTTPLDAMSNEPMTVYIDSSSNAHGAALFQGTQLITMWSAINRRPHASSSDSEITGLSRALNAFKPYLIGYPFTVLTDNRAVLSALNPENQSDVIKRHLDTIQYWFGSRCSIKHIAGVSNQLADLLSRSCYLARRSQEQRQCMPINVRPSENEIQRRLNHAHFGHWGYMTTLQNLLLEYGRYPYVENDVRAFVDKCPNCSFSAAEQIRDLPNTEISRHMNDRVHMDFAGPYFDGTHMLVLVDDATKWVETVHTPSTSTQHVLNALQRWTDRWGPIALLVTDNASCFCSDAFRRWTELRGIEVSRSPGYYHQGNSLAERTIQTLLHRMRRLLNGSPQNWPEVIQTATHTVNSSWSSVTLTTPQVLTQGLDRNGVLMDDADIEAARHRSWENMEKLKQYELRRFSWKHPRRSKAFQLHDKVLWKNPNPLTHPLNKLAPLWLGPFHIVSQCSNSTWLIKRPGQGQRSFLAHSSQLRLFSS